MNKYYYDLHIHSCLSPCADNDMTPENIAGMASINGLNIVALTDHNTTKNCRAFFAAAKRYGIVPIAGAELTTAEDIHLVGLFKTLDAAEEFDDDYQKYRVLYKNKKDIFGDQLIYGENDKIIGEEEYLLLNASVLSVAETAKLLASFDAVCFPAHIDRDANGIIAVLGDLPDDPHFNCVELHDSENIDEYITKYRIKDKKTVVNSDAHYLWDINEAKNFVMLEDEPYSSALVREELLKLLGGK